MNPLIEALMKFQGGYRAKKFMSANEPYLQELSDIAEYGDPNDPRQEIVGYTKDGRPIYSGGYSAETRNVSELESRSSGGDKKPKDWVPHDAEGNPINLFDQYKGFSGKIANTGVWGRRLGQKGNTVAEIINQSNPRGDKITSANNFFEMVMNPYGEAPVTVSQAGRGRGSSLYGDLGPRGVGQYRDIGIGPFRLPYGTYQGPEY